MDAFLGEMSASQYDELLAFFQLEAEDMKKQTSQAASEPSKRQAEWG